MNKYLKIVQKPNSMKTKKSSITKLTFLHVLFHAIVMIATAQKSTLVTALEPPKYLSVTTSFWGNFPNGKGLAVNIQYPIHMTFKEKTKPNGKVKSKEKYWLLGVQNIFYSHPKLWSGYTICPNIALKSIRSNGFFTQKSLGLGLQRTFLNERTYTVDDNLQVAVHKGGSWYFVPSFVYGFGWDFNKLKNNSKPLAILLSPSLSYQYPMNSTFYANLGLELGVTFNIYK